MVGAVGINVSWVFAWVFVIGCFLAGLGGALVAPTQNITQGMDHAIIIEAFLIVIIGGLGNIWGALLGALDFRADRCHRDPGLAPVRHRVSLPCGGDGSGVSAEGAAEVHLVAVSSQKRHLSAQGGVLARLPSSK